MKTLTRASLAVLSVFTLGASAQAAEIVVTPADLGPGLNKWHLDNYRDTSTGYSSTTTAAITDTKPRSGNGSVEMSLTDGSGKADYVYTWGYVPGRTLGNLSALSYDWQRASGGTAGQHLMPAFRLFYDADGNVGTTNDTGYLIFEQVYNPPGNNGPVTTDAWVTSDILGANFWMRQFTPGNTVESYDNTLAEWAAGAHPSAVADLLSADTAILGIEFGIGSGWNGSFQGFVDNVTYRFGSGDVTTFNFETEAADVPEPASLALITLGLLGVAARRRKDQTM
ncbi:PEP-CTERM sorting domain-containing protein [Massilia norwichensis]|uniref:PEP-CTERM sorting domain-containing protein n=1 Tax=Massilia norwichensis TaxID=1442366 RepID=A0ABT2ABZ2_9BURK|nr:PEP-CTERM sorting domain-containing protein [Massilia norwichensis]MCS0591729.1 PEP-CTERM sorting domain-containing protein [Massilia norwichensis]